MNEDEDDDEEEEDLVVDARMHEVETILLYSFADVKRLGLPRLYLLVGPRPLCELCVRIDWVVVAALGS
jgi:hypothetical protein